MTNKELLQRLTEISETNSFPAQFGDGTVLTGLPPNDIYQLGFAGAFKECHLAVREFVDQQIARDVINQSKPNRTAWMVERNSTLWGHEWFCAGEDRWTKDANKSIQFPDQASAKEVWFRLSGEEDENKEFPYTEDGAGDWRYTVSITEHAWIGRD